MYGKSRKRQGALLLAALLAVVLAVATAAGGGMPMAGADPAPPDLTATKTNNVGGSLTLGGSFTWTIAVRNAGGVDADFAIDEVILKDNLPSGPTYGTATKANRAWTAATLPMSVVRSPVLHRSLYARRPAIST